MRLLNLLHNPHIKRLIVRHRQNWLIKWLNDFSLLYHKTYENFNYHFDENGEYAVLRKIKEHTGQGLIFDVGANVGDWSKAAVSLFPAGKIYAFEILPNIMPHLKNNLENFPNISIYNIGLSDTEGETFINYVESNSALSTCLNEFSEEFHKILPKRVRCETTTGDLFCKKHLIQKIDFLKIDVEGLEGKVLKGFTELLQKGSVRAIQFEYGYASLSSNFFLKDFYKLLKQYNMSVGKIYPTFVDFSDYNYMKEDFIGPNYLAVLNTETELLQALKSN